MCQGKTRILVTNQLQFVRSADIVVVMADGAVSEMGPYAKLMADNKGFSQMMAQAEVGLVVVWVAGQSQY